MAIIEDKPLELIASENYDKVSARYKKYKENGLIEFTTFHQSFGYEEFIEGIKPNITGDDKNNIEYKISSGLFKSFCERAKGKQNNHVFIIDEINRGNISKIFGELITLIEPSKRLGAKEEITALLPYSNESFGVPDNVFLLGTMNTADRSIATIDTALRRRFQFREMMPDPSILKNRAVRENKKNISIKDLLESMNRKICVLYDREHTIGHAYFIELKEKSSINDLARIFENNIIPLLQEYFYEDYEKIRLVLGDNKKEEKYQFIKRTEVDYNALFGKTDTDIEDMYEKYRYEINPNAFYCFESYESI